MSDKSRMVIRCPLCGNMAELGWSAKPQGGSGPIEEREVHVDKLEVHGRFYSCDKPGCRMSFMVCI